ncbi:hypothetical protein [Agrococcus sp. TSP3-2-1]|uniref:hypothetical protein n=1 Tax=Agrococcus sp. TSP3-2-1 TaxID=2804583 RepID=UPI003CF158DF
MGALAVVLIGVSRAGDFPELRAVESAVDLMNDWALTQTTADRIFRYTDADGTEVTVDGVIDRVEMAVNDPGVSKLLIYFSGHGFAKDYSEYWLLSKAPRRAHEAVNVTGSVALALQRRGKHIVFVSDACRTLPSTIDVSRVSGSPVFPNDRHPQSDARVDEYYACLVGAPAYEVPSSDGSGYAALFTRAFADALRGNPPVFVSKSARHGRVVRSGRLRKHLPDRMIELLDEFDIALDKSQVPHARVSSTSTWISKLPQSDADAPARSAGPKSLGVLTIQEEADVALRRTLDSLNALPPSWDVEEPGTAEPLAHNEVSIRVDGASLQRVAGASVESSADSRRHPFAVRLRVEPGDAPARPLLLELTDGGVMSLPVIGGSAVRIECHAQQVVNVSYDRSGAFRSYHSATDEILRHAVAAASQRGLFDPVDDDLDEIVQLMRGRKEVDPSLALYTAYALYKHRRRSELADMRYILHATTRYDFFDLALLDGGDAHPYGDQFGAPEPGYPLLSQGWPYFFAMRQPGERERTLFGLRRDGLWTSFAADAWDILVEEAR